MDWGTVGVLGVIFLATAIRSAFGFGEALIAVPLLALLMPVEVAVPLAVLLSIIVAAVVVARDRRHVDFRSAWRLVLATLFGIPLGLWLLIAVAEPVVKAILGCIITAFSGYCLLGRTPAELKGERLAWLFGFGAGVMGGAYGMNGPPLVIYGALRRWHPERFRATLQGYFLPASVVVAFGHWFEGLWVPTVTWYFVTSLPVALGAIVAGRWLTRHLDGRRFILYVHAGMILVGLSLLAQAVWR